MRNRIHAHFINVLRNVLRLICLSAVPLLSFSAISQSYEKRFKEAEEAISKNKNEKALKKLDACLDKNPHHVAARKRRIEIQLAKKNYTGACSDMNELRRWGILEVNQYSCPDCEDKITPAHVSNTTEKSTEGAELSACEPPQYPGGENALLTDLNKNIVYPVECIDKGIEGKLLAQFIVDVKGNISDIVFIHSPTDAQPLQMSTYRAILTLKTFQPATINGKAVNFRYALPVTFKLQ